MTTKRLIGLLVTLGAIAAAGAVPSVAHAEQHQNANMYAFWNWGGTGFWNVDQHVRIDTKAKATYWAQQFFWTGANYGAAMGLQTDGNRSNGTVGDTAIFSGWNANGARGSCRTFGGEGVGYNCAIAYNIVPGRLYRMRIWRQESDASGQWWGAWIKDEATGVDTAIGGVRVPHANTTISTTQNFVEYYGAKVGCTQVPRSINVFTQPAANSQGGGLYQYGSTYSSGSTATCVTGSSAPYSSGGWTGVRMVHGGRVPQATRVVVTHGLELGNTNNCTGTWGDMLTALRSWGWTAQFTVAKYYSGDTNCSTTTHGSLANVDIGAYGSHTAVDGDGGHVTAAGTVVGHSTDARIKHLAQHWAWMVHDRHTRNGYPIKAIGHSMGGLIMRSAIKEVQAGTAGFPPRLVIEDAVTLGTPHTGSDEANACALTHHQCRDLRSDSDFLNELAANGQNPQADGRTEWSTFASDDDNSVNGNSGIGMSAADEVVYQESANVGHGDYMHKEIGAGLTRTDAEVDAWHFGTFCAGMTHTYWPVSLTSAAMSQPVAPC